MMQYRYSGQKDQRPWSLETNDSKGSEAYEWEETENKRLAITIMWLLFVFQQGILAISLSHSAVNSQIG